MTAGVGSATVALVRRLDQQMLKAGVPQRFLNALPTHPLRRRASDNPCHRARIAFRGDAQSAERVRR
jgi:hypothetical protein